jgi:hypothetical protein
MDGMGRSEFRAAGCEGLKITLWQGAQFRDPIYDIHFAKELTWFSLPLRFTLSHRSQL